MKEAHLHTGGGGGGVGWRWVCPPQLCMKTDTWLGNNDWGLVIGNPPRQQALSPTWMLPELLACHRTTPLFQRKVSGGGGAINHQFKRAQAPLGDTQGNITQLLEQNFYLLYFSTLAGQQHSYSGRRTCTSSLISSTDKDMSLSTGQIERSPYTDFKTSNTKKNVPVSVLLKLHYSVNVCPWLSQEASTQSTQ